MMRSLALFSLLLTASLCPAQIAVLNVASSPPNPIVAATDPGGALAIDFTQQAINTGSISRANAASNAAYVNTEIAVNKGNATPGDTGWTIEFWYRPTAALTFGYIFGDAGMVSPLGGASGGRFRLFQSGTSGVNGGLTLRGVPNACATGLVGAVSATPLTTDVNAGGWVHIAFRYDPVALTIDNFINGNLNISVVQPSPMNWTTTAAEGLAICGDRGSSSGGGMGNFDDFRVYNFARTDGDIAFDFNFDVNIPGNAPSGTPFRPDQGLFDFEGSVDTHTATVGINLDPLAPLRRRRFIDSSTLSFTCDSPTLPGLPASAVLNILPGGGEPSCSTSGLLSSFNMCHALTPPFTPAIVFPDGLNIGSLLGIPVPVPFVYGAAPIVVPAPTNLSGGPTMGGLMGKPVTGDEIHIQWLAIPSPGYPTGIGVSNKTAFSKIDPMPGGHVSAEIRGAGAINVQGFFRIHNVGTLDIAQVVLDASTSGTVEFNTIGALNSGGMMSLGSSYRFGSEIECSLSNFFGGGTGFTPSGTPGLGGDATMLTFDFDNTGGAGIPVAAPGMGDGFSAGTDTFVFDTDTAPGNVNGNLFIGATLTVTFTDTSMVSGTFVADPTDPLAAVIDL